MKNLRAENKRKIESFRIDLIDIKRTWAACLAESDTEVDILAPFISELESSIAIAENNLDDQFIFDSAMQASIAALFTIGDILEALDNEL